MNNYCTNCGEKLTKEDLACPNCNTPVVDLPEGYKTLKQIKNKNEIIKIILISTVSIFACFFIYELVIGIAFNIKLKSLKTNYVEPFLTQNYDNSNYSISYDSSGKCLVSGNCSFDPVFGCDGGTCQEYVYLDASECYSYYFNVKNDTEEFIVTVFNKNGEYGVVRGKNIYGEKSNNYNSTSTTESSSSEKSNNTTSNTESTSNTIGNVDTVLEYPYESTFYIYSTQYKNNTLYLDNNGLTMNYFNGKYSDENTIYISGHINNPLYLKGKVNMSITYFDDNKNQIGLCQDTIELLGEGYSAISFSCLTGESELNENKNFDDIAYYKINVYSIEIEN